MSVSVDLGVLLAPLRQAARTRSARRAAQPPTPHLPHAPRGYVLVPGPPRPLRARLRSLSIRRPVEGRPEDRQERPGHRQAAPPQPAATNLVLRSTHWPRDLKHLDEHLHTIQSRLGDRHRAVRNLYRLNCLLALMLLDLLGGASITAWTHPARQPPPPRRQAATATVHDGDLLSV